MPRQLLVIDDDTAGCRLVAALFEPEGYRVTMAHDGREGLACAAREAPDVVLLDILMPGLGGLEVLEVLRRTQPSLKVIMLTSHAEVRTAVRAMQLGAFDYLTKPIDADEILLAVRRAVEDTALKAELADLRRQVADTSGLASAMGQSAQAARVQDQVRRVAASNLSVLILGETGTGKELVAEAIHRQSQRRQQAFVAIDCGAIPEPLLESELFGHERGAFTGAERRKSGQFSLADGGTMFLDEIGNLAPSLQGKLLRVLESRQVQAVGAERAQLIDVRFIAATNDDLQSRIDEGRFRSDLYFRLAQYTITLPPLRERIADIEHLARRFIEEASTELRRPVVDLTAEAVQALEQYDWPGNVRELRNVIRQGVLESNDSVLRRSTIQRSFARSGSVDAESPPRLEGKTLRAIAEDAAREAERRAISEVLRATQGNKSRAARALSTDFKTLHLKMKSLGLRGKDFSP